MMVRSNIVMLALCLSLFTAALPAGDTPRAFVAGSYQKILASHPQRPLLITFWSLDCAHCLEELPRLGEWAKQQPHAVVVMVSTDTPDAAEAINATLHRHGLATRESWVFAEELPERLRHEIDRRWRGELPRTVLRGRDGTLRTVAGRIELKQLDDWLRNETSR